ncbi:MAG: NAD(P)-dependent alcohol dehydrogenase, partial [Promethearchaeota archaeon]
MENNTTKMKAVVCTKYGAPDVLQLKEVEKPIPKDDEVLIKIYATTVTMGDCEMRGLQFSGALKFLMRMAMGFRGPRKKRSILGQELAGIIELVGSEVT